MCIQGENSSINLKIFKYSLIENSLFINIKNCTIKVFKAIFSNLIQVINKCSNNIWRYNFSLYEELCDHFIDFK